MKYNYVYSSSNIYAPFCLTSIHSLLMNNHQELRDGEVNIFLISNDFDESNQDILRGICERYHAVMHVVDTKDVRDKLTKYKIYHNVSTFLKIFLSDFLPIEEDKAMFIDSDTYVCCGIKEIYDTNIENNPVGMALDQPLYPHLMKDSDLSLDKLYYNAGVILINLKYWRDNDLPKKFMGYFINHPNGFIADDQGIINGLINEKIVRLPFKANAMKVMFSHTYKEFCDANRPQGCGTEEEFLQAKKSPVIVHFHGPTIRPWEKWCGRAYTKEFRKLLFENFPDFKLQKVDKPLVWLIKQYLWNRYKSISTR